VVDPGSRGLIGAIRQFRPLNGVARPVGSDGKSRPTQGGENQHERPPQVEAQRAHRLGRPI
jgi:hypothetical protein